MLLHKGPEPFAKASRLIRDIVEFAGKRLCPNALERVVRHKLRLLQPIQQAIAVADPVDRRIDRRRDRIQEIQSKRVGDKNRGLVLAIKLTSGADCDVRTTAIREYTPKITCPSPLDKLSSAIVTIIILIIEVS